MNELTGTRAPEVHPVIITDRELIKYVDDLDIDLDYLSDYLRSRGLTDEQIQDLTIEFSAKNTIIHIEPTIRIKRAMYDSYNSKCTIWLGSMIVGSYLINASKPDVEKQTLRYIKGFAAQSIAHEAEHYVSDVERNFAPDPDYIKFRDDGDESSDEVYNNQPEEIRARSVEDNFSPAAILIR